MTRASAYCAPAASAASTAAVARSNIGRDRTGAGRCLLRSLSGMDGPGPLAPLHDDRDRSWLILAVGAVVTAALVTGLIALWPDGDGGTEVASGSDSPAVTEAPLDEPTTRPGGGNGEPSQTTTTEAVPTGPGALFDGDFPEAYADLLAAAGGPTEVIEVAVYDTYAFLAYRDPANPGNIDRRMWRDGVVDGAEANPIDDRADADTEPKLFGPGELDPTLVARLVADAPSHYDIPTVVTHVLVDRFLPFDERVLIRVYATPTDGRSGGGYVKYDTTGALVGTCC